MKVERIDIERMPGVDGLALEGFADELTVVTGPNESGKSSLVRALRAMLWGQETAGTRPWDVAARIRTDDGPRHVVREGGRTRWTREDGSDVDALALPDPRYAGCFTIEVDQLGVRGDDGTDELARQLRTELNGGVDVLAARAALAQRAPTGVAERKALRQSREHYSEARQRQRELAATRQRLDALVAERDALQAASRRHGLLEQLAAWRGATLEIAQVESELAQLPAAQLAHVQERDRETWKRILEARDDAERAASECGTKLEQLARSVERSTLDAPLQRAQLEAWAGRVTRLERAQLDQERLEREHDAAHAAHAAAAGALAIDVVDTAAKIGAQVPAADIELARRIAAEHAALDALEAAHARRAAELAAGAPGHDTDTDGASARPSASATRAAILATAAFGLVAAAWVGIAVHRAGWGVLALVAACAWVALRSIAVRPAEDQSEDDRLARRVAERHHAEEGLRLDERRSQLEARGDELAARLGVRVEQDPGAFADWLHRVAQVREAATTHEAARAARDGARSQVAELEAALAQELAASSLDVTDAAAARAALAELERASTDLAQALQEQPAAAESMQSARASAERARAHRASFLAERGVDAELDDHAAEHALEQLWALAPAWRALDARRRTATAARDAAAQRVPADVQAAYGDAELGSIEQELVDAAAAEASYVALVKEVERASGDIGRASEGHELTDALAMREEARAELEARRAEALRSHAAAFLVDWAASSYARDNAPPIVADANEILRLATSGRYSLTVSGDQVAARDSSRMHEPVRRLDELSTGTRAQLLIATRVAFARHAERGERVPIFVDEALTTTDPDRFEAIVGSLAQIAERDGRQVVYLTSNPGDAARVQAVLRERGHAPAAQLSIGAGSADAGREQAQLQVAPRERVPAPLPGEDSVEWAARIGVRRLDPHVGADAAHLWHLHEPDLDLVHRLVDRRIDTLGPARELDRGGLLDSICSREELDRMRSTWRAWDAFVAAWVPGRGRRLEREDDLRLLLERAGIAASWHAKLWPFVAQADGDPLAFDSMWELPAAERGFPRSSATMEKLRIQLEDDGYLPGPARLDDAAVAASVRTAVAGDGTLAGPELEERIHCWLERAAAGGGTSRR